MSDGHIYSVPSVRSVLSRVRPVHVEAHDGELLEGDGEVEGGDAGGGLQLVVAGEVAHHDHPPEHAHVLHQSEVSSRRVHQSQLTCSTQLEKLPPTPSQKMSTPLGAAILRVWFRS